MGLKNPIGKAVKEKYVYVEDPILKGRVESLQAELAMEKAKEPVVKEVIKEVPSPTNLELLEKYNAALREIGALKAIKPRILQQVQPEPQVQIKTEVKTEVKEVVRNQVLIRTNYKLVAMAASAAAAAGGLLGAWIF